MEAQPIRILLVDDDAPFLHSLEALLTGEPGLEIVGVAASGEEALAAAARAEPDVAVIDVLMPTMSGIECARLLQERYPKVRVILISGSIFEDKPTSPRRARNGRLPGKARSSRAPTRDDPGARGRNNRRTAQPNKRLKGPGDALGPKGRRSRARAWA